MMGGVFLTAGLTLGATVISSTVPYWQVGLAMLLVGLGVGMTQQNLVLPCRTPWRCGTWAPPARR
ncbi:hypothetical protein [Pseudonocardia sp. P1]|uniref:hypothetical protein n=1 Tax=Pseudonocardia sp. P1 TaxID=761194 RepID=UPI00307D0665